MLPSLADKLPARFTKIHAQGGHVEFLRGWCNDLFHRISDTVTPTFRARSPALLVVHHLDSMLLLLEICSHKDANTEPSNIELCPPERSRTRQ